MPFNFGHKHKPHETEAMGWLEEHAQNPAPLMAGIHTFKAIAIDSAGDSSEATMTLTVKGQPKPPTVFFPEDEYEVYQGYEKFALTLLAKAQEADHSITSVTLYRNGELVRVDSKPIWNFGHSYAPYEFGAMGWLDRHEPNPEPLLSGEHIFRAVATDSQGLQAEAFMTLIVKEVPAPTVNFVESDIELIVGYPSLSLSITAESIVSWVSIERIELLLNDSLVRDIYQGPYTWGGEDFPDELIGIPAGTHNLTALAFDTNGKSSEASMDFLVRPAIVYVDSEAAGFSATNLIDGDISDESSWSADKSGTKSVVIDLGEIKTITGSKLWTTLGESIKYEVYIADSLDGQFVKVAKHQNKHDDAQPTLTEFYHQGRYVKLKAIGQWPNINEFTITFE